MPALTRRHPIVLELDLTEEVLEQAPGDPFSQLVNRRKLTLPNLLAGLRRAREDRQVVGLVAKVGTPHIGMARVQELRDAVSAFGQSGKPTVAWAETFGELGPDHTGYYLACAFGEIWLQPSGDVGLTGVAAEVTFLRDALDKAGITTEVAQRHEFKNAPNVFTERSFTPAHREATTSVVTSLADQMVAGIAGGRQLSDEDVRRLFDRGPLPSDEAVSARLVDRLGYRDEVYAELRRRHGDRMRLLYLQRYRRTPAGRRARRVAGATLRPWRRHRGCLALIHVTGAIRLGRSGPVPFAGGQAAGSDTVTAAFRAAVASPDVKGVVFRVDSPGGSYAASDTIWREVARAREAGKPVVVSMGDLAGSGGYFVAMGADAIVAEPGTLTGSIGVFAGKPVVDGLFARAGISHDEVAVGTRARMFSTWRGFTSDEWDHLNAMLDRIYDDFTAKFAAGRHIGEGEMDKVARGRVWTGVDAERRGLVDHLGGLDRAIELGAERAGLGPRPDLRVYPRTGPLARLRPPRSSEDPAAAALPPGSVALYALAGPLERTLPEGLRGVVATLAGRLGLAPAGGVLLMPPPWGPGG